MFLIALIFLLIVLIASVLKITRRNKTGDMMWGEPWITIIQIACIFLMVVFCIMSNQMAAVQ